MRVVGITFIWACEGWLYLGIVLDLYSHRNPGPGLIFHTDRGSQYCSNDFQKTLRTNKMLSSMSRTGDCWDNAMAESFYASLKTERVFFNNYKTREDAKNDIFDYIEIFYNNKRRHSYLGNISPKEYEKLWEMEKAA